MHVPDMGAKAVAKENCLLNCQHPAASFQSEIVRSLTTLSYLRVQRCSQSKGESR